MTWCRNQFTPPDSRLIDRLGFTSDSTQHGSFWSRLVVRWMTWWMVLTKKKISAIVQQAMNPQQTISDVTTALRPALLTPELPAAYTCKKNHRQTR